MLKSKFYTCRGWRKMFRSRDIKNSFHRSSDPQNFTNATQTALQGSQSLRLPRSLRFSTEVHAICTSRFTKCCACHEICSSSAQSAAPATSPATEGAQSAAYKVPLLPRNLLHGGAQSAVPATKSALPMRKVALLPRNLLLEVLKLLRLPRNLQFQCTKCRSCHEICY